MFHVYVVDDEELILSEIVTTVPWMDNGFTVCGFSTSASQAKEEILALKPDVVFTDLKMPSMDGIELMTCLKGELECEFVLLSAYGTFEDSRSFFLNKGFDYILKPLEQNDMSFLLQKLYKKLVRIKGGEPTTEDAGINPEFLKLIIYVKENYRESISLKMLSKQFNLSANYICNLFAKHQEQTLTRFISELRMQEAARLIKEGKEPFKVIGLEVGYADYYYFCKVFRDYYGMSPSEYRKSSGLRVKEEPKERSVFLLHEEI